MCFCPPFQRHPEVIPQGWPHGRSGSPTMSRNCRKETSTSQKRFFGNFRKKQILGKHFRKSSFKKKDIHRFLETMFFSNLAKSSTFGTSGDATIQLAGKQPKKGVVNTKMVTFTTNQESWRESFTPSKSHSIAKGTLSWYTSITTSCYG